MMGGWVGGVISSKPDLQRSLQSPSAAVTLYLAGVFLRCLRCDNLQYHDLIIAVNPYSLIVRSYNNNMMNNRVGNGNNNNSDNSNRASDDNNSNSRNTIRFQLMFSSNDNRIYLLSRHERCHICEHDEKNRDRRSELGAGQKKSYHHQYMYEVIYPWEVEFVTYCSKIREAHYHVRETCCLMDIQPDRWI